MRTLSDVHFRVVGRHSSDTAEVFLQHPWPVLIAVAGLTGCAERAPSEVRRLQFTDTLIAQQVATIGELDGPPEHILGLVSAVAADSQNVYVADRLASSIRAYDRAGTFLAVVGSEGEGPGEFIGPNDLTIDPAGRLHVRDRSRLTVLKRTDGSLWPDSVVRTVSLGRLTYESPRASTDGSMYYFPTYYYYMFFTHRFFYLVFDSLGATGDTLPVPLPRPEIFGRANYSIAQGRGGQPVEGVNTAPFEPKDSWAITPEGNVVTSPGDRYELVVWGLRGDTVRVVRLDTEPRRVPDQEWRDSAAAFASRVDTIPVPLDEVRGMSEAARRRDLPRIRPEVLAVHVDPAGNVWVKRWPPDAMLGQTFFDVFGPDGSPRHSVRVPAMLIPDPPPWVSDDLVVGVMRDETTGIDRVGVFAVPTPRAGG